MRRARRVADLEAQHLPDRHGHLPGRRDPGVAPSVNQHDRTVTIAARHKLVSKTNIGERDFVADLDVQGALTDPFQETPDGDPGRVRISEQRVEMKPEDALRAKHQPDSVDGRDLTAHRAEYDQPSERA